MLSGEGNEIGKKKKQWVLLAKKQLCMCSTLFCTFLCRCFEDCNVKRPDTSCLHVLWRQCRPCSCSLFFFTVAQFHPGGCQHPAATKFHVVPPTENVSFVFCLSLQLLFSLSFAGLSPYFLFFSVFLFLYIPNLWT